MNIPRLLCVALLATVCTGARPDLARLYALQSNPAGQPPVVFVPGLPGSLPIRALDPTVAGL